MGDNYAFNEWVPNKFEEKIRGGVTSYYKVVKEKEDAIAIYNAVFERLPNIFMIKHNPWESTDKTEVYDLEMVLAKPYLHERYIVYFQYKGSVKAGKLINFHIYDYEEKEVYYLPDITLNKVSKELDSINNLFLVVNQIRKAILRIQDGYPEIGNDTVTVHLNQVLGKSDKSVNEKRTAEEVAEDVVNNISGMFSRLWKGFLKWLSTD